MFCVYVLYCVDRKNNRKRFYVGFSEDISERIVAHHSKSTSTTKSFDTIQLVYYEACLNKTDAIKRERQLKTGFGRGYIGRRIKNHMNTLRD